MGMRTVVGAGLILGAFATIAVVAFFSNQQLYLTVDELVADSALYPGPLDADARGDLAGRRLQVRGTVDYATLSRPGGGLELRFDLTGKDGRLPVRYAGMVPDTFEQAEAVTVAGVVAVDGTFQADDLVVQCPSKYEAGLPSAESMGLGEVGKTVPGAAVDDG